MGGISNAMQQAQPVNQQQTQAPQYNQTSGLTAYTGDPNNFQAAQPTQDQLNFATQQSLQRGYSPEYINQALQTMGLPQQNFQGNPQVGMPPQGFLGQPQIGMPPMGMPQQSMPMQAMPAKPQFNPAEHLSKMQQYAQNGGSMRPDASFSGYGYRNSNDNVGNPQQALAYALRKGA